MPLLKSSIKANKQNIKRRKVNKSVLRELKSTYKLVTDSAQIGNLADAEKKISTVYSQIDRAVKKNLMKKNTGSRRKAKICRILKSAGSKVSTFEKKVKKVVEKTAKKTPAKTTKPKSTKTVAKK